MRLGVGSLRDIFFQALYALKENSLRTMLSILGIAVGVAAVMVVGTVSHSIKQHVFAELETFGLETVWIYRRRDEGNPYLTQRDGSGIDNEDIKALDNCCPAVRRLGPVVYSKQYTATLRAKNAYAIVNLEGVSENYLLINRDSVVRGRWFIADDLQRRKPVALIGSKVRDALFGPHVDPVGQVMRWGNSRLTVIGVLGDKKRDLLTQIGANTYDAGKRVLIPYTLYQQQLGSKDIHTLQAQALDVQHTQQAVAELLNMLALRHDGRFVYTADTMDRWIRTADELLHNITLAGILAASISLFVGGIGIMNIMTTSVVERTREIGIRKALGARRRDILVQFLIEAKVVSLIGGGIGLVLGGITILSLGWLSGYAFGVSWSMALFALLLSAIVGIVSGYFPARRAAGLKPVDALRFE